VEDYTGAGLQIFTTLDPQIQRGAERAVYANLARLDLVLRGYQPPADSAPDRLSHLEQGTFVTGRIQEVTRQGGAVTALRVRFGAIEGNIPKTSLDAFFRLWNRNKTGSDALPSPAAMAGFAAEHFKVGNLVYCGVPRLAPEEVKRGAKAAYRLEIAQRPQLQGAAQVVQEGKVLANVGGFGNTGYDRVNQARRQFGSAFKPFVYAAALELGWHALDPLSNQRQAFQLGNLIYFPKPDHAPEDTVSMAWAGRRSENIASVWLLYHLFDKTDFAGFWEKCRHIGFDPDNFMTTEAFEIFVRDTLGIVLDAEHLRELRYRKAATDLAVDLTFDGRLREAGVLRELPYGIGYARERDRIRAGSNDPEDRIRREILARNYLSHVALAMAWRRGEGGYSGSWVAARSESDNRLGLFATLPGRGWRAVSLDEARRENAGSLYLGGDLSLESLRTLEERLRPAEPPGERYTRENLFVSKDFRAQAAMRYVTQFSRTLGVTAPLDEVLSFPLGVNVITLGEAVNAYQVFQEGARHRTRFGQPQLYIERIQTADGRVIFEDYAEREDIFSEAARLQLEAVLASVVQGGTARRIGTELRVTLGKPGAPQVPVSVPAYGKTGTTNDYRNAAFLGFVAAPKGQGKGFDPSAGYTIGVYTGFDDNRVMARAGFRGTGASAAIPAWLAIAQEITRIQNYASRVDAPEADSWNAEETPLFQQERYKMHKVSRRTGLPLEADASENPDYVEDLSAELSPAEIAQPARDFAPLWIREE
jgi:penicillin-binding protein 1A